MIQSTSASSAPTSRVQRHTLTTLFLLAAALLIAIALSAGVARLPASPEEFAAYAMIPEFFAVPHDELPPYQLAQGEHRIYYMHEVRNTSVNYSLPADAAATCTVISQTTGAAVPMHEATTYRTYSSHIYEGVAVSAFTLAQSGVYLISCGYADGASAPRADMMLGQISGMVRLAAVMRPALPVLAWVLPLGSALGVAVIMQRRHKKQTGRV